MEFREVESSNIEGIGFSLEQADNGAENNVGTVGIRFKSGSLYHFHNVPEKVFLEVALSDSVGKAFNQLIRTRGYTYNKYDPVNADETETYDNDETESLAVEAKDDGELGEVLAVEENSGEEF